jgi:hypothetical protein
MEVLFIEQSRKGRIKWGRKGSAPLSALSFAILFLPLPSLSLRKKKHINI